MGLGTGIMRTILIFFNTLFLLGGLAGMAGGIWMAVKPGSLFTFLKVTFEGNEMFVRNAAYVLIGASCLIILIAALGCYGACARSRCSLGVYAGFMIFVLAVEIAAIVLVVVFDQKFSGDAKKKGAELLQKNYKSEKTFQDAVDSIQKEYKCCGVIGRNDYDTVPDGVPSSCGTNTKGCYDALKDWVKRNLALVLGVTIAIIVFEIILFIFAICLCRSDRFEKVV